MSGSKSSGAAASSPAPGSGLLKLSDVVALTNTHPNTIRSAADSGVLKTYRLPSGHRRWLRQDVLAWLGIDETEEGSKENNISVIAYARVSGNSQSVGFDTLKNETRSGRESDLSRQVQRLKDYAQEKFETGPVIFSDTGPLRGP